MTSKMFNSVIILIMAICCAISTQGASGATIPAGTTVLVKTTTVIHSRDVAGRKFKGELARAIGSGKAMLPAGTPVGGVVESSWYTVGSVTRPLTLRLSEIIVRGHAIPVKSDDFEAKNSSLWNTRRGVQVTSGNFLLQHGTILHFRLTQPVEI